MDKLEINESYELGSVKISNEVVAVIAGLAATEVAGVAGMTGNIGSGITELLGKRNLTKGVKVEVGEKECACDIYIVVKFGVKISQICNDVQIKVKDAVESMTGLRVVEVNVHVTGVLIDEKDKQVEPTRVK